MSSSKEMFEKSKFSFVPCKEKCHLFKSSSIVFIAILLAKIDHCRSINFLIAFSIFWISR